MASFRSRRSGSRADFCATLSFLKIEGAQWKIGVCHRFMISENSKLEERLF